MSLASQVGSHLSTEKLLDAIRLAKVDSGLSSFLAVESDVNATSVCADWPMTLVERLPLIDGISANASLRGRIPFDQFVEIDVDDGFLSFVRNMDMLIGYEVGCKRGAGVGSVSVGFHSLKFGRILEVSLGTRKHVLVGFAHRLTLRSFIESSITFPVRGSLIHDPIIQNSILFTLTDNHNLRLGLATENFKNLAVSMGTEYENERNMFSIDMGANSDFNLSLKASTAMAIDDFYTLKMKMDSESADNLSLGAQKKLSESGDWMSMRVCAGLFNGISLKFSVFFASKNFLLNLPIKIFPDVCKESLLLGFAIPSVLACIGDFLVVQPLRRHCDALKKNRAEAEIKKRLDFEKTQAKIANALAVTSGLYDRKLETEADGLIIDRVVLDGSLGIFEEDVHVALQMQVSDSFLQIPQSVRLASLIGLHEFGTDGVIHVWYRFRGRPHYFQARDMAGLSIPQKQHLVALPAKIINSV